MSDSYKHHVKLGGPMSNLGIDDSRPLSGMEKKPGDLDSFGQAFEREICQMGELSINIRNLLSQVKAFDPSPEAPPIKKDEPAIDFVSFLSIKLSELRCVTQDLKEINDHLRKIIQV